MSKIQWEYNLEVHPGSLGGWSGDRRHPWIAFSDEELLKVGGFYNRDPNTGQPGLTLAAALLFGSDEIIQSIGVAGRFDAGAVWK